MNANGRPLEESPRIKLRRPTSRLGAMDPRQSGQIVCPHCWQAFAVEDTLFIACHEDFKGDALLGPEHFERFLPSRFTPQGHALDPAGMECADRACPLCHLRIPQGYYDRGTLFLPFIGAPGCGKSCFLSALIWHLRRLLPERFCFDFSDADTRSNVWLNAYEEALFIRREGPTTLAELAPDSQQDVRVGGRPRAMPRPAVFALEAREDHPKFRGGDRRLKHNVVLYDRPGQDFLPGRENVRRAEALPLLHARALVFLFDPLADPRFAARAGLPERAPTQRQDLVLTEIRNRMARYDKQQRAGTRDVPLLVVVPRFKLWQRLLSGALAEQPFRVSEGGGSAALDRSAIECASQQLRHLLMETCPEIVTSAEGLSRQTTYLPVSALPEEDGAEKACWVTLPFLWVLANMGFIPYLKEPAARPVEEPDHV